MWTAGPRLVTKCVASKPSLYQLRLATVSEQPETVSLNLEGSTLEGEEFPRNRNDRKSERHPFNRKRFGMLH
jgi:hypothetical protein